MCARYGARFWTPGSGIIHQVVLEQYAFPGGMMIGTDSHTPNAGGLGMVAVGVGGADAVDVMTGFGWNVRWPELIGMHLTGELDGWASPQDVILKVAEILTVAGGTGAIVEYFGPGAASLSATGKATICNMGAGNRATTSLFAYDDAIARYLKHRPRSGGRRGQHRRPQPAGRRCRAGRPRPVLRPNSGDRPVGGLGPHINGPTPRPGPPGGRAGGRGQLNGWAPGGERRSGGVVHQLQLRGHHPGGRHRPPRGGPRAHRKVAPHGHPGSEQVRATIERDGLLADLEAIGATVLANACGPCIGQWNRDDVADGTPNSIVTSYNRNFPKRNDGYASTNASWASPETVVALALAGTLDFDPASDTITAPDGTEAALMVGPGVELPDQGFDPGASGFVAPPTDDPRGRRSGVARLRAAPGARAVRRLGRRGLLRPARALEGPGQVHHRPHLHGRAVAALPGPPGEHLRQPVPGGGERLHRGGRRGQEPARRLHRVVPRRRRRLPRRRPALGGGGRPQHRRGLVAGARRMEPRFRGCAAVIARSFARIHETNLKKQGVLALTFADPEDYDCIGEDDRISVLGLADLAPGAPVRIQVSKPDGSTVEITAEHTLSHDQIKWFRAGSALNLIRQRTKG